MSSKAWVASALLVASGVAACATEQGAPRNGVDDVRAACKARASWLNANRDTCINCMIGSRSPHCDCAEFKDFAGACRSQEEARLAEPSCTTAVKDCATHCAKADCGCLEGCCAPADACKRVTAAADGCVAEACAPYCQ